MSSQVSSSYMCQLKYRPNALLQSCESDRSQFHIFEQLVINSVLNYLTSSKKSFRKIVKMHSLGIQLPHSGMKILVASASSVF